MTTTNIDYASILADLDMRAKAKTVSDPDDNPYATHTLEQVAGGVGILKGADHMPAVNMAAKAPNDTAAFALESSRIAELDKGRADKSARRMAEAKARAERRVEFDRIASGRYKPDPDRMNKAWLVVFHLVKIIGSNAKAKQRWANRLLGSAADDIPQIATEKMALALAKQDKFDLDLLADAAEALARSDNGLPGDQRVTDEDDTDRKRQLKKARKWLMGMVNNRIMDAVVETYMTGKNLRWDNIDLIATVTATINGPGDDPITNRFKADRAPAFLGTRFASPGAIDGNLLAMAIAAALTDRGLDPLAEFLLNDDQPEDGRPPVRRTDGLVSWSEYAEDIFRLGPNGDSMWLWDEVVRCTEGLANPRRARGVAARDYVREQFAFLPGLIMAIVDSFDPQFRSWSSTNMGRALVSSDFELLFLEREPAGMGEKRDFTQPGLKYGSAREAAVALTEHLAQLQTGADLVTSVVFA